jgi:hypothetical protein
MPRQQTKICHSKQQVKPRKTPKVGFSCRKENEREIGVGRGAGRRNF